MSLLNDVDKPSSDVESYIESLDEMLRNKVSAIEALRGKLIDFYRCLKTEGEMSTLYKDL